MTKITRYNIFNMKFSIKIIKHILIIIIIFLNFRQAFTQTSSFNDINDIFSNKTDDNSSLKTAFHIASFVNTIIKSTSVEEYMRNYDMNTLPSESPEQLIVSYDSKIAEIEAWKDDMIFQMKSNLERDIRIIIEEAQQQLLSLGINATTGDRNKDDVLKKIIYETAGKELIRNIIKNKERKIAEKQKKFEKELDEKLEKRMIKIQENLIKENEAACSQYLYAAAYSLSIEEQNKFLDKYTFHKCCISELIKNFDYKSTNWLDIDCNYNKRNYVNSNDRNKTYFELAKNKYALYKKYKDINFVKAANKILELDVDKNMSDVEYYILRAKLSFSIIDKYYYLLCAKKYGKDAFKKEDLLNKYFDQLNVGLFEAIENDDIAFVQEFSEKLSFKDIQLNKKPIIKYIINKNKCNILDIVVNSQRKESISVEQFKGELLGLAIINSSYNCFKKLIDLGFNTSVIFKDQFDLYYLTLSADDSDNYVKDLIDMGVDYSTTMNYVLRQGKQEDLVNLSIMIYKASPSEESITRLEKYNKKIRSHIPKSKEVIINSIPEGLTFNLNDEFESVTPCSVIMEFTNYKIELVNKGIVFTYDFKTAINSKDEYKFDCELQKEYTVNIGPYGIPFVFVEMLDNSAGFYISKYEISQSLYNYIMHDEDEVGNRNDNDYPISSISQAEAKTFVQKLNNFELYNKSRDNNIIRNKQIDKLLLSYRLPTKQEWITACKGGINQNGSDIIDRRVIDQIAWYRKNSGKDKQPSGKKAMNKLGIFDMLGNVSEWCLKISENKDTSYIIMGYNYLSNYNKFKNTFKENPQIDKFATGIRLVKAQLLDNKKIKTNKNW